jgi:hypothetical protein
MSTIRANNITDAAGTGAPDFPNGVRLGTAAVLGPATGSAPMYACRAWVNFNGTTSPGTIRASGNVSSVTRNGTGQYTVNLTTAMPDANYATTNSWSRFFTGFSSADANRIVTIVGQSTNAIQINATTTAVAFEDLPYISVGVFR